MHATVIKKCADPITHTRGPSVRFFQSKTKGVSFHVIWSIKCFAFFQIEAWWDLRGWSVPKQNYAQRQRMRRNSLPNEDFRLERLYQLQKKTPFLFHERAIPLNFFTKGLYRWAFSRKGYTVELFHERVKMPIIASTHPSKATLLGSPVVNCSVDC